jgi:hypothetical protein
MYSNKMCGVYGKEGRKESQKVPNIILFSKCNAANK